MNVNFSVYFLLQGYHFVASSLTTAGQSSNGIALAKNLENGNSKGVAESSNLEADTWQSWAPAEVNPAYIHVVNRLMYNVHSTTFSLPFTTVLEV